MEIEFKFAVPPEALRAVKAEMASGKTTTTHLRARYFDTADGRLSAHGVALRLRREGTHWVQTAKAVVEGHGPLHRLEHNAPLGVADEAARSDASPTPDASRHAGTPVGKLLDHLLDHGRTPLVQTMATDISRLTRHVRLGETTVELALDIGKVIGGDTHPAEGGGLRVSPVCELELELVEGDVADLVTLAQGWVERHGLWFSTVSKAERGLRLALPPGTSHAVKAAPPHFGDAGDDPISGVAIQRAVVAACLAQVLPNASEVASGNEEVEVVHQLRVGIRRLRTALRELDGLAGAAAFDPAWEKTLTEAFRILGARRDGELLHTAMRQQLSAAGAPAIKLPHAAGATTDLGETVRAPAFQAALVALIGLTAQGSAEETATADAGDKDSDETPRDVLRGRLRKLHRQVLRDGRHFESLPTEAQHRVRKRLKRLRYLAEFVGPLFDRKKAERYIAGLEPAQDALGAFNDAAVALGTYREAAKSDPHAWFAVGWLGARQEGKARACRKLLRGVEKLPRFWRYG